VFENKSIMGHFKVWIHPSHNPLMYLKWAVSAMTLLLN